MRKVIFDCDTGSDDAMALMLLVRSKQFEILGITTTWGNQPVEATSDNTLRVLDFLGSDIKVYMGSKEPIDPLKTALRNKSKKEGEIYYTDELGGIHHLHPEHLWIPETSRKVEEKDAISFICDTLNQSNQKVTLIPVGPASNIARAILKDRCIVDKIDLVCFMGGSMGMGNVTPSAEANFFHDCEAIKIILESGVKCTIASLNATTSASFDVDKRVKDFKDLGSKEGKFASEIVAWRADVSKHLGWSDGKKEAVHDPLAVAYLLDENIITNKKKYCLSIDCSTDVHAGTLLVDQKNGNPNCEILLEASEEKYYQLLAKYFSQIGKF